jgi:hypothetical protein
MNKHFSIPHFQFSHRTTDGPPGKHFSPKQERQHLFDRRFSQID